MKTKRIPRHLQTEFANPTNWPQMPLIKSEMSNSAAADPNQIGKDQDHCEVEGNEADEDTNVTTAIAVAVVILCVLMTGIKSANQF